MQAPAELRDVPPARGSPTGRRAMSLFAGDALVPEKRDDEALDEPAHARPTSMRFRRPASGRTASRSTRPTRCSVPDRARDTPAIEPSRDASTPARPRGRSRCGHLTDRQGVCGSTTRSPRPATLLRAERRWGHGPHAPPSQPVKPLTYRPGPW